MSTATATRWSRPKTDTVALAPEQCVFRAAVQFAEKVEEGKPYKLRIRANSGEPMDHWYFGRVAVDLSGVRWTRSDLPILLDHNPERIVGYTNRIGLEDGEGLVTEGVLSKKTEEGTRVRELALEGFPWQASVMLEIDSIEDVGDDVSVQVNGYTLQGPAVVLRKTKLREVTVTTLGADENTDAELFGDRRKGPIMSNVTRAAAEPQGEAGTLTAPTPDGRFTKADVDSAAAAERSRVAKIMAGAATNQRDLALSLIEQGTPADDALLALIKARKETDTARLDAITAAAPPPLGGAPKAGYREIHATFDATPAPGDAKLEARAGAIFDKQEARLKLMGFDREAFLGLCQLNEAGLLEDSEKELLKGLGV